MEAYNRQTYGRHLGSHVDDSYGLQPWDLASQYVGAFGRLPFASPAYREKEATWGQQNEQLTELVQ